MYGCESWTIKKAECQRIDAFGEVVVLEKTLESPLDCKEIQPVHPEGNQSWIFIGRTDAEAETPILWPSDVKNWLIWKDPGAGKDWMWEEKWRTEDEMALWHHWLNGHEFDQVLGVSDRQGGLVPCCSWGHKESDMNEQLNWTELNWMPGIMEEKRVRINEIIILCKHKSGILLYLGNLNVMFNIFKFYFSISSVEISASKYHWKFKWKNYLQIK